MTFWISKKDVDPKEMLLWNSPCKMHQKVQPQILMAELFTANLTTYLKKKNITPLGEHAVVTKGKKQISFNIPVKEFPSMIYQGKLIFLREVEGIFYYLSIGEKGEMAIFDPPEKILNRQEAYAPPCPNNHGEFTNKHPLSKKLYASFYCRMIWNADSKKFVPVYFGDTCN